MGTVRGIVTRRPWITGAVAALVVVAAGGVTWWATSDGSKAAASPTYRLVTASVQTMKQSVSTSGTIEPADQENVNFAAGGRVTSVRVAQGDRVRKGQVLATIDSAALAAQLAEARATLAQDQVRVQSDQSQGVSAAQLSADQAALAAAQGQVDSAQAAMNGATLRSPITGVVATVGVSVGEQVSGSSASGNSNGSQGNGGANSSSANSSSGSSTPSANFLVIGTSSWVVNASVDDTQVGLIKKGNQAQITTDGGTTVDGTVSSVGLISSSSSGTATYPVTVKVTGSPTGLHAGATGTVLLIYKQLANVLTVPSLAVHGSNGRAYVEELSNGSRVKHPVTTGLSSGGLVQIVSGLAEGDRVVVDIPQVTGGTGTNRNGNNTGGLLPGGGFQGGKGGGTGGGNVDTGPVFKQGGNDPQGGSK